MQHNGMRFATLATLLAAMYAPAYGAIITDTYGGALPVTRTGTLPDQASVFLETFTLAAPGNVTAFTTSYATGGFQTSLLLFTQSGTFITGSLPAGAPDPVTMIAGDSSLTALSLAAGNYTVALTDFLLGQPLDATSLAAGFTFNIGNGSTFVDSGGNTRTGNYSLTITLADASGVPEPGIIWMFAPIVLWGAVRSRKYFI